MTDTKTHWNAAFAAREEDSLTWYEGKGGVSLDLITRHGDPSGGVLIAGAGLSRLTDLLWSEGVRDLTILDISDRAVEETLERFPDETVTGIVADLTAWKPQRTYSIWQDRAVFHFLTDQVDQTAYLETVRKALAPGGLFLIGTFAEDGPEKCSNLPVRRYSAEELIDRVKGICGQEFRVLETLRQEHVTPKGNVQPFTFVAFRNEQSRI